MASTSKRVGNHRTSTEEKYIFSSCTCTCDAKKMGDKYQELRESNTLCDVTLKVQGTELAAHKIILAAKSPYFKAMFTTCFSERQQSLIELDKSRTEINGEDQEDPSYLGLKAEEFKACIDFIYTEKFEINKSANLETLMEIVKVANFLELSEIQEWVTDIVVSPNSKYLNYENIKMVSNLFGPYDYKNIIKKTVRSEVVANWEDYIEEFPDDWEFVLTVWPDFKLPFKISTSESLDGLTKALRNINENSLNLQKEQTFEGRCPQPSIELAKSLGLFKCKNPEFYFECCTKLEPSMRWIGTLDSNIIRDEGDVLLMAGILAKILKEKDEKNERASFAFPLHLMQNFGSIQEVRNALGKLLDNADVKLEFCQQSIRTEFKREQEVYCENDDPDVMNDELSTMINNRLKEIDSMIMQRAGTRSPPLQCLVVSKVDLTHLWRHCLAEVATESVYVTLKNINISLEFLDMLVHYIEKKSRSPNFPLRRISFSDCLWSEFQRKSVSQSLTTIACNLTELDFSKSKLNSSDLKELALALKAKAVDKTLALRLLSLRSIDTIRTLQPDIFADLVCSAEIVDLAKSKIRPSQLKLLTDRVFSRGIGTRLKRLGLMNFVLVHDHEMSDSVDGSMFQSHDGFVYASHTSRPNLPDIFRYLATLLALLEVCSFSGSSCNQINPTMFEAMKDLVNNHSENKDEAKLKVNLLTVVPRVDHMEVYPDHDYQARSQDKENTLRLSQQWQAHYWDIYKGNMTIPSNGAPWTPADTDRCFGASWSLDGDGDDTEPWSPKTEIYPKSEPPTQPSSPDNLMYNFDIDGTNSGPENAPHEEVLDVQYNLE